MRREIVLVCGVTGSGKTTWAKQFSSKFSRLFVYDIGGAFDVEYVDGDFIAQLPDNPPSNFRYGVYSPYDADTITAASYLIGNCWIVLEEISTLYNVGARVKGPIQEAILLGRQRALSMLIIAQRASYIPITLRSQASRIVSFRQQEPADVKYLVDFMGDTAYSLPSLPDLHCVDWHKGVMTQYALRTNFQTNTPDNTPDNTPERVDTES